MSDQTIEGAPLADLLRDRFSCRAFRDEPVPEAVLTEILQHAQRTPSWCNTQPWGLWVTQGETTDRFSRRLFEAAGSGDEGFDLDEPVYEGKALERRRRSGFGLYAALGIERADLEGRRRQMLENYRFFGARTYAVVTSDRALGAYGVFDCGGYIATLLMTARAFGVDTIAQAAIARYSDAVRDHFDIPQDRTIICGVAFGYADRAHPANSFRAERDSLAGVVNWRSV